MFDDDKTLNNKDGQCELLIVATMGVLDANDDGDDAENQHIIN